jgi:hypothetical protein
MRVRVTVPTKDGKRLRDQILEGAERVEDEETGQAEWEVVSAASFLIYSPYSCTTGDVDRPRTVHGD